MKLLFLTGFLPYPPRTGGTIIAYHHIKHLAQQHEIDLVAFTDAKDKGAGIDEMAHLCKTVQVVTRPSEKHLKAKAFIGKLTGIPGELTKYQSPKMEMLVQDVLALNAYDAEIYQGINMAQYKRASASKARLLLVEDPMAIRYTRAAQSMQTAMMRWRVRYEGALLSRFEAKIAQGFDRIIMLNESDRRDYERMIDLSAQIRIVPYGVDVHAFNFSNDPRDFNEIVMTGNMFHPPNVEAVLLFAKHIYPLVRKEVPAAHLTLVGARPAHSIQQLAKEDKSITVTGTVPDMKPYLQRAAVSVSPIQLKIGTQTKVLEALACGTPVVTTSAGNNGVGATHGEHLYVADDHEVFARHVASLLRGEHWAEMSAAGRQFVVSNFAWESVTSKLEQILVEAVQARSTLNTA